MALTEALMGLENRWRAHGVDVADCLRPGLPANEVRSRLSGVGDPHGDVVAWYGWHDGCHLIDHPFRAAPSGRLLTQLVEALELREWILGFEEQTEQDLSDRFAALWLPVATTRDAGSETIAVDLVTGVVHRRDNVPSSAVFLETNLRIADSLEELVRVWCDELDRGAYFWDQRTETWAYDRATQPADLRERNIVA